MRQDWIDHLRGLSEGHEKQVPDAIWDQVKNHIPQKSKNRRLLPWLWLMAGTMLISGWYYVTFIQSAAMSDKLKSINSTQTSINESVLSNRANGLNAANTLVSAPKSEKASGGSDVDHPSHVNRVQKSSGRIKKNNSNLHVETGGEKWSASQVTQTSIETGALETNKHLNSHSMIEAGVSENSMADIHAVIESVSNLPLPFSLTQDHFPKHTLNLTYKTDKSKINCYQFSNSKKQWGLEFYAGPTYSPYQLKDKQGDLKNYLEKREATESTRTGLTAGIRGLYRKGRWTAKLGLEYHLLYEQLHSSSRETRIISVYRDGKLLYVDTLNGLRVVKHHNYHHLFNVPLMLNFQWNWKHLDIGLQPGIGLHVWSTHTGKILNQLLEPVYFDNVGGIKLFDHKIIPYLSFHVPIGGRLNDDWAWFVEPGIQFYLKPFNASNYPIDQKYSSYQLRLGFQKIF